MFSDAKSQLQELKEAVVKYQQKAGLTPQGVAQLDTVACKWSEIQKLIEVATSGLGSDDESDKIKLSCSKIARNVAAFDNWLNLLPDGDYGAVVCGVFKMVVLVSGNSTSVPLGATSHVHRRRSVQTIYRLPSSKR